MVDEYHYIPANNMFASFIIGGVDEMKKDLEENYRKQLNGLGEAESQGHKPHETWYRHREWYKASCEWLIEHVTNGGKICQDYPPFKLVE